MVSDRVTFRSEHFAVTPGEDRETNPGIFGQSLASWVAAQLKGRGVPVERVVAEDFGRCVFVKQKPYRLWVTCASLDGRRDYWQMFLALEPTLLGRVFGNGDGQPDLIRLREQYRAIVREIPGAADVEWENAVPHGA